MALRARPYGAAGAQFLIGIALINSSLCFFMIDAPFNIIDVHQLKYVVDGQWNAPIVVT